MSGYVYGLTNQKSDFMGVAQMKLRLRCITDLLRKKG